MVPDTDQTKALRALTRAREDLVEARVALANELRAQLEAFWPGAAAIFADVDSPIALAFLRRYPSPTDAHGLGEQRLERFLARHHYCGDVPHASCSAGCAAPPAAAPTPWRPKRAARSSSRSSPRWSRSSPRSPS